MKNKGKTYHEIRVCGSCFKEYTEKDAKERINSPTDKDSVCPYCEAPGFYLILDKEDSLLLD